MLASWMMSTQKIEFFNNTQLPSIPKTTTFLWTAGLPYQPPTSPYLQTHPLQLILHTTARDSYTSLTFHLVLPTYSTFSPVSKSSLSAVPSAWTPPILNHLDIASFSPRGQLKSDFPCGGSIHSVLSRLNYVFFHVLMTLCASLYPRNSQSDSVMITLLIHHWTVRG